jgi:hypothetical protein
VRAPSARTALAALLLLLPRLARSQVPDEPWSFYLLPYPSYNSLEGFSVNLIGDLYKAPPPGPIPIGVSLSPYVSLASSGSRIFSLTWDNSGRVPGWRFLLLASYEHLKRAPYFGLGNATVIDDSLQALNGGTTHYYRYVLGRTTGIAAVERSVASHVRAHVGVQYRHYRAEPLGGLPTALGNDVIRGVTSDTGSRTSVEVRGGLIFDTRNEEASPASGVFVSLLGAQSLRGAGDLAYARWAADAREFLPLSGDSTVILALRQAVQGANGALPFYVAYERLTTWLPEDGFGGLTTLRQNLPGRWDAPFNALASVDLRYKWWDLPLRSPVRLWLVLHADVGRVWEEGESFAWSGLHSGYGTGAIAQLGRVSFFGFELGWSPDAHVQFNTTVTLGY